MPAIYVSKTRAASTTSDIALSGSAVIASETAINYVVNTNGNYTWNIGGNDNKDGLNGASEVMRINASGNVGIGTDSPAEKLTVISNQQRQGICVRRAEGGAQSVTLSSHSIGNEITNSFTDSNPKPLRIVNYNEDLNSQSTVITFSNKNNVGIGTEAPAEKLHVDGNAKVLDCEIKEVGSGAAKRTSIHLTAPDTVADGATALRVYNGTDIVALYEKLHVDGKLFALLTTTSKPFLLSLPRHDCKRYR